MSVRKSISTYLVAVALATASTVVLADACVSASTLHQQKVNKYKLPSLPSLLEDCGINDMIEGFGGSIFGGFDIPIGDFNLFCGYSARDVAGWYGVNSPNSIGLEGGLGIDIDDVNAHDILGDSIIEGISRPHDFELNPN